MLRDGRHGGQVVGIDAGTDVAQAGGAVEVGIDGDHPIEAACDQLTNDLLADRFAGMKCSVLPHVAEIGRDKNKPPAAISPKRFRGKQQGQRACRSDGREAHRRC